MQKHRSALDGIRVLDLSTMLAAPMVATMLADFGAEVVKVESPAGDPLRTKGTSRNGRSLLWLQEGRNRRSVCVDLRQEEGRALVRRLIPKFDVVVTNMRPHVLEEWGFGPSSLSALHPSGILVYVSGFGLTGPNRERGSMDRVATAFAGQTYVSGENDGNPVRSGFALTDYMSGYVGAFAVVTALYHRDAHGGAGQIVDLAMFEPAFRATEDALTSYSYDGSIRRRQGNRTWSAVPASDFVTRDGKVVTIHAGTDRLFRRLAVAMGRPELVTDRRFATYAERVANQDELYDAIEQWARTMPSGDLVDLLVRCEVPVSPVMSIADIASDAHYAARGLLRTYTDEDFGEVMMAGVVPRMSGTPGAVRQLGPVLGAHTDEVLRQELALTTGEIERLREQRLIAVPAMKGRQS